MNSRKAILILGGTAEAACLAEQASGRFDVTYSLAGRTANPTLPDRVAVRTGGFGGAAALADWLTENGISALIDATHPFADRMARNAADACAQTGTARLKLLRPPWNQQPGDDWRMATDVGQAAAMIQDCGRRAFLSVGRQDLQAFAGLVDVDLVIRSIDPPADADLLPGAAYITGRGPFSKTAEEALLREHRIEMLVSKNAGGTATYPKIAAARKLRLPVIMIDRPELPDGACAATVAEALSWLGELPV